jgi:hypothetical protein
MPVTERTERRRDLGGRQLIDGPTHRTGKCTPPYCRKLAEHICRRRLRTCHLPCPSGEAGPPHVRGATAHRYGT